MFGMLAVFGADREATLARELTKTFETIRQASLAELHAWVTADNDQQKGEFVILVHGAAKPDTTAIDAATERMLTVLMAEQNFPQALRIADRGYVIVHGQIAFEGRSVDELNNNELIKKFYLGL